MVSSLCIKITFKLFEPKDKRYLINEIVESDLVGILTFESRTESNSKTLNFQH